MSLLETPYHPLVIHFPIAFYCLGMFFTLWYLWQRQAQDEGFAYRIFGLSLLASLVVVLTGVMDRGQLDYDDPRQAAIDQHVTAAMGFIICNALLLYFRFRWPDVVDSERRWVYLTVMLVGLSCLVIAGHNGGVLVYQLGVGVNLR